AEPEPDRGGDLQRPGEPPRPGRVQLRPRRQGRPPVPRQPAAVRRQPGVAPPRRRVGEGRSHGAGRGPPGAGGVRGAAVTGRGGRRKDRSPVSCRNRASSLTFGKESYSFSCFTSTWAACSTSLVRSFCTNAPTRRFFSSIGRLSAGICFILS